MVYSVSVSSVYSSRSRESDRRTFKVGFSISFTKRRVGVIYYRGDVWGVNRAWNPWKWKKTEDLWNYIVCEENTSSWLLWPSLEIQAVDPSGTADETESSWASSSAAQTWSSDVRASREKQTNKTKSLRNNWCNSSLRYLVYLSRKTDSNLPSWPPLTDRVHIELKLETDMGTGCSTASLRSTLCTSVAYGVNKVFANQQLYFSVTRFTAQRCATRVWRTSESKQLMENKTLQRHRQGHYADAKPVKPKSLLGNRNKNPSSYYTLYTVVKNGVQSVKLGYAAVSWIVPSNFFGSSSLLSSMLMTGFLQFCPSI